MAVPVATTTVTVLRPPVADDYAEPYADVRTADLTVVVSGVRAVLYLGRGTGRQATAGGEQTVTDLRFSCDPADVRSVDYLRDADGVLYRVTWCFAYPGSHIEGGLELVEGLV